ncbi:hypothetical protein BDV96DRAFT_568402 [Lophiotrema nucula]|uniref:Lysine decarboxylase-like protein-like protein n=1 Tax=Lophiotrema nucula TaxID=690887 RepID=A0A6A5ZJY0_9PLEO|nr:hypothetical protein BDV96DRAFT_568402 [Lophiotrema nucula]
MGSIEGTTDQAFINKPFTVAVFCGAHPGSSPVFAESARSLAQALHGQQWRLVYGGGTVGLMGEVSRALVSLSGSEAVHGIIPSELVSVERKRSSINADEDERTKSYGSLTVVKDMHARKSMMAEEADAFVALPGGFGTMEEVMEIITWSYLGIHAKPIVLFNVNGYYDSIIQWVKKAVVSGFVDEKNSDIVVEASTAEDVIEAVRNYRVPQGRFDLNWGSR